VFFVQRAPSAPLAVLYQAEGEKFMFKIQSRGAAAWATAFAVAAGVLLAGCGGGGASDSPAPTPTPGPSSAVASLEITPASIDDFWGYSVQTQVTARDSAGVAISPRPAVTLTAGDASIAGTDSPTSTVNLLRPGQTTVTAAVGSVMATSTVNVRGFERLARVNQDTMCALADGRQRIYCWGSAGVTGTTMITSTPQQFQYVAPTPIPQGEIPAGSQISKVASDQFNMCALTDDGAVFCWGSGGNNSYGIGIGVAEGRSAPTRLAAGEVPSSVRFVDVGVAPYGGCAVGDDGRLYCWGAYNHIPNPALAINGRFLSPLATVQGDVANGIKLVKVVVDENGGCALGDDGRAYCWNSAARTPRLVAQGAVPVNVKLIDLQLAGSLPCALADNGQIYCWGTSFGYRFGAGQSAYVSSAAPTAVVDGAKPAGVRFTAFTVGGLATASCAVAEDGALYCWARATLAARGTATQATTRSRHRCACSLARKRLASAGRRSTALNTPAPRWPATAASTAGDRTRTACSRASRRR
jgi:alpha-tubulin suppressor-like RCC1 family protein